MFTKSMNSLKVFDLDGNTTQELYYASSNYKSIDVGSLYLVYAESSGQVGIATYKSTTIVTQSGHLY